MFAQGHPRASQTEFWDHGMPQQHSTLVTPCLCGHAVLTAWCCRVSSFRVFLLSSACTRICSFFSCSTAASYSYRIYQWLQAQSWWGLPLRTLSSGLTLPQQPSPLWAPKGLDRSRRGIQKTQPGPAPHVPVSSQLYGHQGPG